MEQNNKYGYIKTENEDYPYTVIHKEQGTITLIALSDSAEKADFIAKSCNQFNLEQYEKLHN